MKLKLTITSLILLITVGQKSFASGDFRDTLIQISIENFTIDTGAQTVKFDIHLVRISEMWHLWENATFQFEYINGSGTPIINYDDFEATVDLSQSEIVTILTGQPVYEVLAKSLNDAANPINSRVILRVIGPQNPIDAKVFAEYSKLKLCTVILTAKNSNVVSLPREIAWKEPFHYYQAIAYKFIDEVNTVPNYVVVANESDHIEMLWETIRDTALPQFPTQIRYFEVEYTGNFNVVCRYSTMAEYNNAGFIIKRGFISDTLTAEGYEELPDSIFTVTVGDFRDPKFTARMQGLGNNRFGKEYDPLPDTIEWRVVNYVYRLFNENIDEEGVLHKLATRNLITPNAVIWAATAYPNPTRDISHIKYELNDDVYLTVEVYDQNGKKVKTLSDDKNGLLDMTYVRRGEHIATFDATDLASQGFYNVQFIAYPINDKSVELSTAHVKVQLIRGHEAAQ